MIFKYIWERYFFRQFIVIFLLFIFCFYGLYILIDYSSRGNTYRTFQFSFLDLGIYYFYVFIQRLDILLPFAFLIAIIRTLCQLNIHNELIALMTAGIKLKKLLRPFLIIALFLTFLQLLNNELLLPYSWRSLKKLEEAHFNKFKNERQEGVQHVDLNEEGILLYHSYDSEKKMFQDVYWIPYWNEIFHMKLFYPFQEQPLGKFVDHFERMGGKLLLKESMQEQAFPKIQLNLKALTETLIVPDELSITQLWGKLRTTKMNDRDAHILTALFYKISMPWLCVLVFIGPAPFCLKFSRQQPIFFIYLCSMLGTVIFYLVVTTTMVLGENQVIHPIWTIIPFILCFAILGWRYYKLA